MGVADLRNAFHLAARGQLRLDQASLRHQNNGQVLNFTGWHADNTPFAFVSAPFHGHPNERAAQIAADLIQAHTGGAQAFSVMQMPTPSARQVSRPSPIGPSMPTPPAISGLAALLRQNLAAANARAAKIAADFPVSVATLNSRLDEAEKIKGEIDAAANDIQQAMGMDNGGPSLSGPLSPTSPPSSTS